MSWNASSGATFYGVKRATASGGSSTTVTGLLGTTTYTKRPVALGATLYQQDNDEENVWRYDANQNWWSAILYHNHYVSAKSLYTCPDFPDYGISTNTVDGIGQLTSYWDEHRDHGGAERRHRALAGTLPGGVGPAARGHI